MEIIMATIKRTYIKFNNQFFKSFASSKEKDPDYIWPQPTWTDDESQAGGYTQDQSSQDMLKSAISNICSYHDISDDKLELITKDVEIIPFENTIEF